MGRATAKWRRLVRRSREPEITGTRDENGGLDRRTLLLGTATTAGVVAASTMPASAAAAAPAVSSVPLSLATVGSVAASDVSVVPAGEIIDTDVQAALEALDRRLSKTHLIDDLQVAMTIVDDFMGNTATSGTIGELGWALADGATGSAQVGTLIDVPGMFKLGTGTATNGWHNLNLGSNNLLGSPVLVCEWRLRISAINAAPNTCSYWFGLHNNLSGNEPGTGFYFRGTAADGPNWQAVCADGGARTVVNTGVAPQANIFQRFRITCDGAGVARFYIDSTLVATITTTLPSVNRYAPAVALRKTGGTTARIVMVDYFALRYEKAR